MGRKTIVITPEAFTPMLTAGWESAAGTRCIEGLPPGARLLWVDGGTNDVHFTYEHPDWPETDEPQFLKVLYQEVAG